MENYFQSKIPHPAKLLIKYENEVIHLGTCMDLKITSHVLFEEGTGKCNQKKNE